MQRVLNKKEKKVVNAFIVMVMGAASDSLCRRCVSHLAVSLQANTEALSAVGYRDVKCNNREKLLPFPAPFCFQGLFDSEGRTKAAKTEKKNIRQNRNAQKLK